MEKNIILDLEKRRRIYQLILKNQGLHLREISRELDMSLSTLRYHIKYLKKRELVIETTNGNHVRYYTLNKIGIEQKKLLELLRNETIRHIILLFSINLVISLKQISRLTDKHPNTIKYHFKKLIDLEIIEPVIIENGSILSKDGTIIDYSPVGREKMYQVKDLKPLWDTLITNQDSFLDDNATKDRIEMLYDDKTTRYNMPERWKPLESQINSVIKLAFEFFPIPFCA